MTLDVLFHLMKMISPEKNIAGENIHSLITLLSSENDSAEMLSPFIHRLRIYPKTTGSFRFWTSRTGPGCATPLQAKFKRLNLRSTSAK